MAGEARGQPMWEGAGGAPPALVQYLNGVLSQNPSSPSALPYADDVKWTARDHLLGLLNRCVGPLAHPRRGPLWALHWHARGQPRMWLPPASRCAAYQTGEALLLRVFGGGT